MATQFLSQTPNNTNLELRQNQNWTVGFIYEDQNGDAIDLTGYNPILQFRTSALAKTTVLSLSTSSGLTFTPSTTPQVQVDTIVSVAPGKYEWDLALVPTSGEGNIFLGCGTVTVNAEVSR